jgi:hypothetical protein
MTTDVNGQMVLDHAKLKKTIQTAMRMLDNVIDINYYAVAKARTSNMKHRPVGLGIMGFQDCLHMQRIPYASDAAVKFADTSMEAVCYYAYQASSELAKERGAYSSYQGSLWDRGILPQDTLKMLQDERGGYVEVDQSSTMDWNTLRAQIKQHGMRNSNCVAIAPTATISNIIGSFISNEIKVQQSYKVFSTIRNVKFTEMEYNIPIESYQDVMKEMLKLIEKNNYKISFPQEHRFVQKDDIYLSPAFERNSAYIASHVFKGMNNTRYFKDLEDLFVDFGGRPHWGKMHTRDAAFFQKAYPKFDDFLQVRAKHDPNNVFVNDHLKKVFGV